MADGIYYADMRLPFVTADATAVAPTTTAKPMWNSGTVASSPTLLPANYWTVGKTVKLEAFVKLTTGTAGNSTFSMAYGSVDAPTCVVSTASAAKIASVGPFGIYIKGFATCRSTGTAGTLSMWGQVQASLSVFLSTVQPLVFPNNGTTVVSTIDTTVGTNHLHFGYLTSAGTDSIQLLGLVMTAMN